MQVLGWSATPGRDRGGANDTAFERRDLFRNVRSDGRGIQEEAGEVDF